MQRPFFVITEPCGGCKDRGCVDVCPVDCIHEGKVEVEGRIYDQLFIDPEECIFCGICVPECPVDAIYPLDELPEPWQQYPAVATAFYEARRTQH